ncbi:MAG: lactonase family protein [Bacillus sp. (in: firmicutes)]
MSIYTGYIGTYTKGESKGIYSFTLDTERKKLGNIQLAAELENPTYVAVHPAGNKLYAVSKHGDQGGVSSYDIGEGAELMLSGTQLTEGSSPCHISIDSQNRQLATAYYHRGTVEFYTVSDGKLSAVQSTVQHKGKGPNLKRQDKPHVHFSSFSPDERFLIAVDLGTDQIVTYTISDGHLEPAHSLTVKAGSGPRHLVFHPNGKYAYVMTELSNEVIFLAYDQKNGCFKEEQYVMAIPSDFTENSQGSAIHISNDGRFVYAGNRGHDTIAVFAVEPSSGKLSVVQHIHTGGSWPRDFVLDPSQAFLVASNQESHNLVLFGRDEQTGLLTKLESEVEVPFPVCVKFLHE